MILKSCSSKVSILSIKLILEKTHGGLIIESLLRKAICQYGGQFKQIFCLVLDSIPEDWEDRTSLFIGHIIDRGIQSGTVKSYVSTIKGMLIDDGYDWQDGKILLSALAKACKLVNDRMRIRQLIHCSFLELILLEIQRRFSLANQYYLETLYKAIFALGYYGLFRVGELTNSPHAMRAANIHLGMNKDKILVVLYSSKTHNMGDRPQKVKIVANRIEKSGSYLKRNFCPFKLLARYMHLRGDYLSEEERFFVFRNRTLVKADAARRVLKDVIKSLGLNQDCYDMHLLRIERASDLIKYNYPIDEVRRMGRWRSNVVFKYIRD